MASFLMVVFALISLYDGFTTIIGTANIMNDQMIISVVFAIAILSLVGSTAFIWSKSVLTEDLFLGTFLKFLWFIAMGYDIYTSYQGNLNVLIGGYVNDEQLVILIGLTILVSASPVIFSYLLLKTN